MPRTIIDLAEFHAKVKDGKRPRSAVRLATSGAATVEAQDRVASFVFSDSSIDRYGDTIDARGWLLDKFEANPVALFGHDSTSAENVIGKARNVRVEGQRLIGEIEFMEGSVNPTAETVYQMVKGGYLNTVSVGFQPLDWVAAKDKSRPGGIDFRKQELLEISIVPIPANPNALVQARAAGIDVDRLALVQPQPKISKKGMYEVSFLAQLLAELSFLEDMVEWEAEYEGDNSDIPQRLTDAMKLLGQVLVDMTVEEVSELIAEEDGSEPLIINPVIMESFTPAQKAVHALAHALRSKPKMQTVSLDIELTPAAKDILGQLERAGKVLSSTNEKSLRDAHAAITQGCETIKGVLDTATTTGASSMSTEEAYKRQTLALGDDLAAARARRIREAEALKIAAS